MTTTREGHPDEITVSPEYVQRSLSWVDGLDAHEGPVSTQNIEELTAIAREFAKGYAEHAAILKHVIADRERVMGERNDANDAARLSRAAATDMLAALRSARGTIADLLNMRGSEAEGTVEDWVADIDAAIAKATS